MQLSGSITALITPFDSAGAVDFTAWQRLIEWQIKSGIDAIVVAGSTGEAAALSDDEYSALIRSAVAQVAGRIPVLAGTGQSNTLKTIAQTRLAKNAGADIALVVTPPYVRPTQAGLIEHYQMVADEGGLPVVLYNVPGRTGCDMQPETVATLCMHPNIIGLKEARGDEERWNALYPLSSAHFSLLSGDDASFVRAVRGGAAGVISVASNVVPGTFSKIVRLLQAGEIDDALGLDQDLQALYDFLGCEPNPIPVKAILTRLGCGVGLRLPLLPLSAAYGENAESMTAQCKALELPLV
ncbi:MAG TPA: 4-hydroxy-tetrahydrodipicolinate synthase [Arenimonas sp.]|nr:4-hydroxy-tetrahydrodipicolinate synthase [Arenimonas sp.]